MFWLDWYKIHRCDPSDSWEKWGEIFICGSIRESVRGVYATPTEQKIKVDVEIVDWLLDLFDFIIAEAVLTKIFSRSLFPNETLAWRLPLPSENVLKICNNSQMQRIRVLRVGIVCVVLSHQRNTPIFAIRGPTMRGESIQEGWNSGIKCWSPARILARRGSFM